VRVLLIIALIVLSICSDTQAQYVYRQGEYGVSAGLSQYFGDLNQRQGINYVRYAFGASYKWNFNNYISAKVGYNHALVGGADKLSKNTYQKLRNLSFESTVNEAVVQAEFNFLSYEVGSFENRFTPYINLGIGAMWYNPYAIYNNTKYYLRPLGTEGQNLPAYSKNKYGNATYILPLGLGIKWWINAGVTASIEVGNRFTGTDYLDDVSTVYIGATNFPVIDPFAPQNTPSSVLQDRSTENGGALLGVAAKQRGISSDRDQYIFAQFSLSFRIRDYTCPGKW
jgi:hypothetical protein